MHLVGWAEPPSCTDSCVSCGSAVGLDDLADPTTGSVDSRLRTRMVDPDSPAVERVVPPTRGAMEPPGARRSGAGRPHA